MRYFIAMLAGIVVLGFSGNADAQDKKAERLWKAKCATCHGADGKGETEKGRKSKISSLVSPAAQKKSDADFKKAIADGVNKVEDGVTKEMDGYKEDLSEEQIDSLVAYLRELGKK